MQYKHSITMDIRLKSMLNIFILCYLLISRVPFLYLLILQLS
uniref:Uncharacterized protein n=1 Tax=Rhizophora mucronata TaxID=61149 RepID=A0A2P2QU82_RHIMU